MQLPEKLCQFVNVYYKKKKNSNKGVMPKRRSFRHENMMVR